MNMKKLILPLLAMAVFVSCDKPKVYDQLGDNGQQIVKIADYGGMDLGFGAANLVLDPSNPTVEFKFEIDAAHVSNKDVTVTIGVDDNGVTRYNATVADNPSAQYQLLAPASYQFSSTTAVIPAGSIYSNSITITFNPDEIDPALNLMLPVTITKITGGGNLVKAPGTGTAYFHLIGNPLAGTYHANGWFYHPSSQRAIDEDKVLAPLSSTQLLCDLADLGTSGYVAVFEVDEATNHVSISAAPGAAGAPYTQFDDGLPPDNPGYTPSWPNSAQCNNTYNPATKTFKVRYGYLGSTGWRVTEEIIVKL